MSDSKSKQAPEAPKDAPKEAPVPESYQDYDVTCTVLKVGYDFMENHNPTFYQKDKVDPRDRVTVAVRQQVKSTRYSMADRRPKKELTASGSPGKAKEADDAKDPKEQDSQKDSTEGDSTQISDQDENRVSDYKNEDDQMEVVKQILEEAEDVADEFKKALDPIESAEFTFDFAQKIGEIKRDDEEPLHVFSQNVRFFQDHETNMFLPRLAEFSIAIKGRYGDEIVKQEGKPFQEVFSVNHLNLTQFLRKRELRSHVGLGDEHFNAEIEPVEVVQKKTEAPQETAPVEKAVATAPAPKEPEEPVVEQKPVTKEPEVVQPPVVEP